MGKRRQGVQLAEGATPNSQKKEWPSTKIPRPSGASETVRSSREQSPSYAAALHATSTPASTQKSLNSTPVSRRPSPLQSFTINEVDIPATTSRLTNESVVGATGSLVSFFESKQKPQKSVPVTHSVRYVTKHPSVIVSPTPIKPPIRQWLSTTSPQGKVPLEPEVEKGFPASGSLKVMDTGAAIAAVQSVHRARAASTTMTTTDSSKTAHRTIFPRTIPEPPAPRRSGAHASVAATLHSGRSFSGTSTGSAPLALAQDRPAEPSTALQTSQLDLALLPLKPSSNPDSRPILPVRHTNSFETKVNSLANTIVAASLASSRAPSPTKRPPPPPRRHKSHAFFHSHHNQEQISRTPSPAKTMRQTMRERLPSDDEVEYKRKNILLRKHPHKHHEGDRKRYRATVTERERRRYDGVWAANKGLLMDADSSDRVLNLVVREIWSRSRLPNEALADIWDLVDTQGGDRLERNEFVVGMWLVDQRLKGRKLPFIVSESLWNSVRLLHGVKVFRHQH